MREVNYRAYICDVCGASFEDPGEARVHESGCRSDIRLRDALIGQWVSFDDGGKAGIACMGRRADSFVGVMDAASGAVFWRAPSKVRAIPEAEGRRIAGTWIDNNAGRGIEKAEEWRGSDGQ